MQLAALELLLLVQLFLGLDSEMSFPLVAVGNGDAVARGLFASSDDGKASEKELPLLSCVSQLRWLSGPKEYSVVP